MLNKLEIRKAETAESTRALQQATPITIIIILIDFEGLCMPYRKFLLSIFTEAWQYCCVTS